MQRNDGLEAIKEEDDTVRVDPLNHFNKYRGGYNITNKHYWSVSFFLFVFLFFLGLLKSQKNEIVHILRSRVKLN